MKPFSLFIMAMMLFAVANAQKLSPRQMEENARLWALQMKAEKSAKVSRVAVEGLEHIAVFNVEGGGFVIVGDDSRARRVLGYSPKGRIDSAMLPDNVKYMLGEYQREIAQLDTMDHDLAASIVSAAPKDGLPDSVAPLLVTEWNQYRYGYNSMVPEDSTYAADTTMARFEGHPTVGCVALSMGQIMRYWQYPHQGYGQHSYTYEGQDTCWRYGTVSAVFDSATYDYSIMPNKLTATSSDAEVVAVAKLLFHCGVASNMHYNSDCKGSSGANVPTCLEGMRHFFHYNFESHVEFRSNFSNAQWDNMVKNDIAAGRPVLYAGQSYRNDDEGTREGGHAFVLDGYDTNGLFHVNWGWDGNCNGYYSTSAMRPLTQYDFTSMQYAVFNLQPGHSHLVLGNDLTLEASGFQRGDSIRGQYSITNVGDSVGSMFFGVNIYKPEGGYYGCVDGRRVTVAPGDTVWCSFAYPLDLEPGSYMALMQYSFDSFYAGITVDRTYYMEDVKHRNDADFNIFDTSFRTLTNLVVFVRFRGDSEIGTSFLRFRDMFSLSSTSVEKFFNAMSYGHLQYNTVYAKQHRSGIITSYTDPFPRSHFRPYSAENPDGYTEPYPQMGIPMLEAQLIARIARYVDSLHLVEPGEMLDGDGDGDIDNLSIIVKGDVEGWGQLLWPHMEFFPHDSVGYTVTINGKRVNAFNFEFEGSGEELFSSKVFCHEMCHSIGLPDLYHYNNHRDVIPVAYDLMASGHMCHPSAIYKHKILHLTDEPQQITQNGTYVVSSVGSSDDNNLYYIKSSIDTNQWYTIEYRYSRDPFESSLPGSGLVIGRWMDTVSRNIVWSGNAFYDFSTHPNAYWTFRPGSSVDSVNGMVNQSLFSAAEGRTSFGPDTDPHPYIADGTPERLFRIYDISEHGKTCSFSVEFLNDGVEEPVAQTPGSSRFLLYPNPATSSVEVQLAQGVSDRNDCQLAVLDAVGHELVRNRVSGSRCLIDTHKLPSGVYFVTLTTSAGTTTQKLIIQ
ncbi:MAG: C10 family peptidase [Bacteroidales bacterium]|nr:C10 family peptidase [Bacteroidales bacterium]